MTAIEELKKEKNTVDTSGGIMSAMPSRAKYYYNSEGAVTAEPEFRDVVSAGYRRMQSAPARAFKGLQGINIEDEDLKKDIQSGNPDILPSGRTLQMLNTARKAPAKPFDSDEAVSFKVNSKGRLFFAVYAILVLSLILVIVLNALVIERQKAQNASLNGQIILAAAQIEDLSQKSAGLSDSAYIQSRAQSLGMYSKEAQSVSIPLPQINEKAEYSAQTNWFDWFCDLISG